MKKKIYLLSIALCFLIGTSNQVMACLCSLAPAGDVAQAYATYSGGVLSDPLPTPDKTGTIAYPGQTIYYLADGICNVPGAGCASGGPFWTVSGGTIVVSEFLYTGLYAIGIQWGSAGTGTLTPTNYTGFGVPALSVTINSCSQGNISGAYTSYNTGTNTLSGSLTYPAAVNAGDIVYYKAFSQSFYGTFAFVVTNGTLLNTYTASDGYKVAEVQWGTAGAASIVATAGAFCSTPQSITVTTPELVFDGTDDRVTIGHVSDYNIGSGNFTIEVWINASSTQNTEATIFSKRSSTSDGIWFGLNSSGQLIIKASSYTQFAFSSDLRDDTWHHVAVTRSSNTVSFYVEGSSAGVGIFFSSTDLSTSNDIWIGNDNPSLSNISYTGAMKGLRFWTVAKTNTELLDNWKTNLNEFSSNLIGCWDMNDINTQTQTDQSATANNGELGSTGSSDSQDPVITPTSPAPFTINALLFDGNTQRAIAPDAPSSYNIGTGDFTIEAWILPVNDAQTKTVLSRRTGSSDGFVLYVDGSGGKPTFRINSTNLPTSSSIYDGQWHHIAVTRSGSTLSIYDNSATASNTTSVSTQSLSIMSTCDLWIGQDKGSAFSGFNGQIDEVRIWNIARASTDIFDALQIQNHAQVISDLTQTSNLKGWWRFNAAVDQIDEDLSSVGNNSTLGTNNGIELEDPLRTAGIAFPGSRKGIFSDNSNVSVTYVSPLSIESYPNPFTGSISLKATGLLSDNAGMEVMDITGIEVYRGSISNDAAVSFGQDFPAGMYVVKVTDNSTVKTIKIVKK